MTASESEERDDCGWHSDNNLNRQSFKLNSTKHTRTHTQWEKYVKSRSAFKRSDLYESKQTCTKTATVYTSRPTNKIEWIYRYTCISHSHKIPHATMISILFVVHSRTRNAIQMIIVIVHTTHPTTSSPTPLHNQINNKFITELQRYNVNAMKPFQTMNAFESVRNRWELLR